MPFSISQQKCYIPKCNVLPLFLFRYMNKRRRRRNKRVKIKNSSLYCHLTIFYIYIIDAKPPQIAQFIAILLRYNVSAQSEQNVYVYSLSASIIAALKNRINCSSSNSKKSTKNEKKNSMRSRRVKHTQNIIIKHDVSALLPLPPSPPLP